MLGGRFLVAALVALSCGAVYTPNLIAQPSTVDFSTKGTVSTARFREFILSGTPELNPPVLKLTQWNGLGVVGGTLDSVVDAGESVLFALDQASTEVSYFVQFAQDSDADGHFGETEVEGYGAGGVWLGTVTLDGVGTEDVSAAFSNQPLTAVRMRPSERIRIYSFGFNSGSPVTIGFHDKSNVTTAKFRGSGVSVTPELNPPVLKLTQWNGLGVVGGTLDSVVDAGESVLFALDQASTEVSYFVQFAQDSDADGHFGETEVEGYGAGGVWLGTVTLDGVGSEDVSAAFSNQPLTAVRMRPSERIRVYSFGFTPVPLPSAPLGLTGRAKDYKVNLLWQAVPGATSYRIFRKLASEAAFTQAGIVTATVFVNYLPVGTSSAQYYVVAENNNGAGPPSVTITVTPTFR